MRVVPMPCSSGSASTLLGELVRWPSRSRCEQRRAGLGAAERLAVEVDQRADDDRAGDVAAGVAAHAVGHHEQVRPGIPGVLVVRADQPDVGAGGVVDAKGIVIAPTCRSSMTVLPMRSVAADLDAAGSVSRSVRGRCRWWSRGPRRTSPPSRWKMRGVPPAGVVVVEDERALGVAADERARSRSGSVVPARGPGHDERGCGTGALAAGRSRCRARPAVGLAPAGWPAERRRGAVRGRR